jgi:hypothetical protein
MSPIAWLLGLGVVGVGGFAIHESRKPTGEKVKDGDTVFVHATALRTSSGQQFDEDRLKAFLAGFVTTSVKVTNVILTPGVKGRAGGVILGAPVPVFFDLGAVTSIERNGKRIV